MPSNGCKNRGLPFFLFLLTLLSAAALLPAQEKIEWEAVEGADHYSIEFRQNGELVLETRSNKPSLPLFLPAGNYEFRVKVINTFGKIASESEWSPLKITAPSIPFIIDFSPREIHDGSEYSFKSRVSGLVLNAEGSSSFILENQDGKQIKLEITDNGSSEENQGENWKQLTLEPERKKPAPGSWTLIMTNPDGRENRMENALNVLEKLRPRIRKIDPDKIPAGKNSNIVVLQISGMEKNAVIRINGPSEIPTTLIDDDGEGNLEYSLNLENAETGWYSLTVTNPSGGYVIKEKAIEVLPEPPTPEEIAAATALKIDKKEPRPLPEYPHSIFGGWHFSFPLSSSKEYYNDSYIGFSIGYSKNFSNDLIRRIPGFNGLSWEILFSYSNVKTTYPLTEINLNHSDFLLGLKYVTPFNFPLNLLIRASLGMGFSTYTSPGHERDEWLGSFTLRELDSLDFINRFAAGIQFTISPRWYINLSCDFTAYYYLSRTVWAIQPLLEGGWKW